VRVTISMVTLPTTTTGLWELVMCVSKEAPARRLQDPGETIQT
jgi:hypothetical protein